MLNKIFGIDYNSYAVGGIGDVKLGLAGNKTLLFYEESEMLKTLAELKKDVHIGEISVFSSEINRIKYEL